MRLLILGLLLTASASAQDVRETVALVLGGGAGGAALGFAGAALAPGDETGEAFGFILAYPVGVALGLSATGHALGVEHALANTAGGVALGAALGLVVGGSALLANTLVLDGEYLDGSPIAVASVVIYTATPLVLGVLDFRAEPVILRSPRGDRTAGLRLHLGL